MHMPGMAIFMCSVFQHNWNLNLIDLVVLEGENQRSWQKKPSEKELEPITYSAHV